MMNINLRFGNNISRWMVSISKWAPCDTPIRHKLIFFVSDDVSHIGTMAAFPRSLHCFSDRCRNIRQDKQAGEHCSFPVEADHDAAIGV